MKKKLAIVTNTYPKLSETFVKDQVSFFAQDEDFSVDVIALKSISHTDSSKDYTVLGFSHLWYKLLCIFFYCLKHPLFFIQILIHHKGETHIFKSLVFAYFLKDTKYDCIYSHFGNIGNSVALVLETKKLNSVKHLCAFHGADLRRGELKGSSIYRNLFSNAHAFIANSHYTYNRLTSWGCSDVKLIYNGVDTTKFLPKLDKQKNKKITILSVGRLVWEKDYLTALRAIKILSNQYSNFVYEIIGDGPERLDLEQFVKNHHLEPFVNFLGAKSHYEVVQHMQNSDIFLLSSKAESFGLVLVEAASVELPIVSTEVGGATSVVYNNLNGKLVDIGDSHSMANALFELCQDMSMRKLYGQYSRAVAQKEFDAKSQFLKQKALLIEEI